MEIMANLAANGKEALQTLALHQYDLILLDLQMPELEGLETCQHIRSNDASRRHHGTILAMAAYTSATDRQRCLGGDG
jgi:CheY-like chemotaxis protein